MGLKTYSPINQLRNAFLECSTLVYTCITGITKKNSFFIDKRGSIFFLYTYFHQFFYFDNFYNYMDLPIYTNTSMILANFFFYPSGDFSFTLCREHELL